MLFLTSLYYFVFFAVNHNSIMDPRQTVKRTLKSNLSLDKRSQNFRLQKSQSCSNTQPQVTQPQVVLASKGKMYMMRSVQTDIVPQTPISHAQTNTIPVAKSSTCTQMIFQMNHTSSQTDCIKAKNKSSQYMFKPSRTSFPTKLKYYDIIHNFSQFLQEENQMQDFVNLATGLIENKIHPKNLVWQSALHMGWYSASPTTTVMRYDPEYMEFMAVMNLLFGSSALNVLWDPAHFGSVVSGKAPRGKYEPSDSKCNFPVPSYRIIQNLNTGYPKVLKPGLIDCTLDICEELT